jgi:myo-inositol-1-phosphate synthase
VRCIKLALNNAISGSLMAPSSYFMKSPPEQYPDDIARNRTEAFINDNRLSGAPKLTDAQVNTAEVDLEKVEVEVG